jgi:hypothetical protein
VISGQWSVFGQRDSMVRLFPLITDHCLVTLKFLLDQHFISF